MDTEDSENSLTNSEQILAELCVGLQEGQYTAKTRDGIGGISKNRIASCCIVLLFWYKRESASCSSLLNCWPNIHSMQLETSELYSMSNTELAPQPNLCQEYPATTVKFLTYGHAWACCFYPESWLVLNIQPTNQAESRMDRYCLHLYSERIEPSHRFIIIYTKENNT